MGTAEGHTLERKKGINFFDILGQLVNRTHMEGVVFTLGHLVNWGTGRFSTPVGKVKRPELTDEDMDLATPE